MPPRKSRKIKAEDYASKSTSSQDEELLKPPSSLKTGNSSSPRTPDPDNELEDMLPSDATLETIPTDGETDGSDVDPALLDEEEAPYSALELHDESKGKGKGTEGKKGWAGYNELKSFNGQVYSGMAIGSGHTWNYEPGVWKETKKEPDLWQIDYNVKKRRARNAPKGSGAPVGTQYHWFIVAHQYVEKVDANTYTTHLVGHKYKLAHKGASSNSWSVPSVKGQREREVELLEDAKRKVLDLPPVMASQKVREVKQIKGQQTLEGMFKSSPRKRKVDDE